MDRRAFIGSLTGGLLAAPLAAEAQPAGKVARIGLLDHSAPDPSRLGWWQGFKGRLRELGYVEGLHEDPPESSTTRSRSYWAIRCAVTSVIGVSALSRALSLARICSSWRMERFSFPRL
jgi:hypothetical protein